MNLLQVLLFLILHTIALMPFFGCIILIFLVIFQIDRRVRLLIDL